MEPLARAKEAFDLTVNHFRIAVQNNQWEAATYLATCMTRIAEAICCLEPDVPCERNSWE